jgi:zinc transport system permease protein
MNTLMFSLIASLFVGYAAGYIGSLMVLKKMALVGDALSHVALPGLALGVLLSFNPFVGAFAMLFLSAILTWHIERNTSISTEAIIGTIFTLSLAVGILMIPQLDLLEALFGDISSITLMETGIAAIISVATVLYVRQIYHKVVLSMISEELAETSGINVSRIDLIYLLLVSLIVAVGIKIVGTLLVGAMVIVPAATAKNTASNLRSYSWSSAIFGALSSVIGVGLSFFFNLPTGPLVVISGTGIFLISMLFFRR